PGEQSVPGGWQAGSLHRLQQHAASLRPAIRSGYRESHPRCSRPAGVSAGRGACAQSAAERRIRHAQGLRARSVAITFQKFHEKSEVDIRTPGLRVDISRYHQLQGPSVGAGRQTQPRARFDIPDFAVPIESAPHLMKLIVQVWEVVEAPESVVLFGSHVPSVVDVVYQTSRGIVLKASQPPGVVRIGDWVV